MRTENRVLMQMARETLNGKWGVAVGTTIVYIIAITILAVIPILGQILTLIIGGPMLLGLTGFFVSLSRGEDVRMERIFQGFANFKNALGTYLLMILFVMLWSLLLIVPGIIAALSYSMAFYILNDESNVSPLEAIRKSKKLMDGHKGKYFCLCCRFIGWGILCFFTLGIGFLWLFPYMQVSIAKFYDDIKRVSQEAEQL